MTTPVHPSRRAVCALVVAALTVAARADGTRTDATLALPARSDAERSACVRLAIQGTARVHAWVEADGAPLRLAVSNAHGARLVEARPRVGRTTWVTFDVEAACDVDVCASTDAGTHPLSVALHVRVLAASSDADELRARREERVALGGDASVRAIAARIAELSADPDLSCDAAAQEDLLAHVDLAFWRPANTDEHARGVEALAVADDLRPADARFALELDGQRAWLAARRGDMKSASEHASRARARLEGEVDETELPVRFALLDAEASSAYFRGDLARATELFARELDERTIAHGERHRLALSTATSLAGALLESGRIEESRAAADRVVALAGEALGADDPIALGARNTLASALFTAGDLAGARVQYESLVAARLRLYGERDPTAQLVRVNLGLALYRDGEKARAIELLAAALEAFGDALPATHPQRQRIEANLAAMLIHVGRIAESRPVLERLASALAASNAPDSALLAATRENLANARGVTGDPRGALELREEALATYARTRAPDDPMVLAARGRVASARFALSDAEGADALVAENAAAIVARLRRVAPASTPREIEAAAAAMSETVSAMLSIDACSEDGGGDARRARAFALVESLRAAGATASGTARLVARAGPRARELERESRERAADVARISAAGGAGDELFAAVDAAERAQRALRAAVSESDPAASALAPIDVDTVAARLAPDEAAIGYWIYARGDPRSADPSTPSVLAFVVRRGVDARPTVARVELGPLAAVESAVARWRAALCEARASARAERVESGRALRALVLDPLARELAGATRIAVAPDGALHLVPFDALPDGDGVLGDALAIVVRPTLADPGRARPAVVGAPSLVALGDVDYAAAPGDAATRAGGYARLAGTAVEVESVAREFERAFETPARVLRARDATRAALVAAAPTARFLHLATHGRYVEEPPAPEPVGPFDLDGARAVRALVPLVRCHLALAGANADEREGLVTAEELGALDLSACELAVLSACDTSAGVAVAGQGVASFQKALLAAGARSVVTSLWEVPDQATSDLMRAFYEHLWKDGATKAEALRRAKRDLRARRAPERDWAAWVLAGDES